MDLLKKINIDKIRNAAEDAINQAKPKSDVETRIYEALSHKNWGSSSTLMNEIARDSFDYDRFNTITRIIWESLDHPRPAAWRVVFKALTLLEHLIKNGSERCVDDGRNNSHILRGLFNFNYYEGTVDRGQGVREKSKQVVELVGDDERIREERTKAKQLREKFGGNLGGSSNTGGMAGIGGGGGSGYAGYGNDGDRNYGGYSGSGGYGDSGIGSSGGYSDAVASSNTNSFSGRYSEEAETSENTAPTFAAIPPKKVKKKNKKSKKKKEKSLDSTEVSTPVPEVDLLAMDDPTPATDDDFDAFQGASSTEANTFDAFNSAPTQETPTSPEFDAFQSVPTQQPRAFDAFNSAPPIQQQNQFDAFGSATVTNSQSAEAFGTNSNISGNMNTTINSFGNMSMGGIQQPQTINNNMGVMHQPKMMNNFMGGSKPSTMGGQSGKSIIGRTTKAESSADDDFGEFNDGKSGKSADPLSNLISLDGLTKNKKVEDRIEEPIVFNDAAKAYVQSGAQQCSKPLGLSKAAADMAFSGVDGLHKQTSFNSTTNMNAGNINLQNGQHPMNGGYNSQMNMMNGMGSQMGNMQQGMSGMNQMGMMGGMSNPGNTIGGMNMNNGMGNQMGSMSQQGNMMGAMKQGQWNNMANNGMGSGMSDMSMNSSQQGMMGGSSTSQRNMGGQPMNGWK